MAARVRPSCQVARRRLSGEKFMRPELVLLHRPPHLLGIGVALGAIATGENLFDAQGRTLFQEPPGSG